MKYLVVLISVFCFDSSCINEPFTVLARIVYIEPFPFATDLTGDMAFYYKQAAWVITPDSYDSLAILFDYKISRGGDISSKILINHIYKFKLKKIFKLNKDQKVPVTNLYPGNSIIDSLPTISLIDSSKMVRASDYWLVLTMEEK